MRLGTLLDWVLPVSGDITEDPLLTLQHTQLCLTMCRSLLHVGGTALFALQLVLLLCAELAAATTYAATPLSTHVLNVTLNAAGWPTNSTALATYVSGLRAQVNTTICGSLPSTVSKCNAFMIAVSATSSPVQVAIQVSAQTDSYSAGNGTYTLFSQWAAGTNLFSLSALAGTLSPPSYSTGTYTVPCRGSRTYAFLPVCATTETPSTTVYVQTTSTSLQSIFLSYLCPSTATAACAATVTVVSSTNNYQVVTIAGTSKGLEAVLAFVADARASYYGIADTITGETVGDTSKQLSVTAVELRYRHVRATLFSTVENKRTFMMNVMPSLHCESSYSMWAVALVVIPFLAIGLFRYIFYRGRRRAKKHERRRIVEDETRIMQGYVNPSGAPAAETAPPPGVDTSAVAPQWVMDANGNYYDANAAGGGAVTGDGEPATGTSRANDVTYQTWVDPETGETYQYAVDNSAAGAATDAGAQATQQGGAAATGNGSVAYQTYVDPETGETYQYAVDNSAAGAATDAGAQATQQGGAAATGNGSVAYQTYVDPETGETYQYAVDNSAAGGADTADNSAQHTAEASGEGSATYQTYVNPETGETYQYAVDPAVTGAHNEPVSQASVDAPAADSYQTYVDPETGETYQYAAADASGTGSQQYEYVDPNTGETYVYDASVKQGDGAAADAAAGTDVARAAGETGGGSTYVDPNTGESYQYEADPNGGAAYQTYVDPETGETYQYQDPNAAQ